MQNLPLEPKSFKICSWKRFWALGHLGGLWVVLRALLYVFRASWGSIFGGPDGEVPAVSVRFVEAKRSIFETALGASLEASCTKKRRNLENHTKTNRKRLPGAQHRKGS